MLEINIYALMKFHCKKSEHPKWKHAVIILHNNSVISYANNNYNTHAEERALAVAHLLGYKQNLVLISGRISKDGRKLCMAKPCTSCYWHAMDRGVIEIYYTNERGTIVKMKKEK